MRSFKELRSLLIEAARIAGTIQEQELDWGVIELPSKYGESGSADVVTRADVRSEQALRSFFTRTLPEYSIIGEEYGAASTDNGKIITIDPLDGTKSFKARLPRFGPVIGVYHHGRNVAGVEYNVLRDVMYVATEESGLERIGNSYDDEKSDFIYIGGDVIYAPAFNDSLSRLKACFPKHHVLPYEQDVLTKTLVCEGKLAGFFHAGLARHDIGATPLFSRITETCFTSVHGDPYNFLDVDSEVAKYQTEKKEVIYSNSVVIAKPSIHDSFLRGLQEVFSSA